MWRLSPPFAVAEHFYATSLILLRLRVLELSQSAASPGAAVRVLALGDAFEPEQATNQATVRPTAP